MIKASADIKGMTRKDPCGISKKGKKGEKKGKKGKKKRKKGSADD